MSNIYARILGPFRLSESARQIAFAGQKEIALVAFLCANRGRSYRREFLADLLWERAGEAKSKHSLSQALYAIRRRSPALLAHDGGLVRSTAHTDVDKFTHFVSAGDINSAIALVQGPFLDCLAPPDSPEFDDWRESFGQRLYNQLGRQLVTAIRQMNYAERRKTLAQIRVDLFSLIPELENIGDNVRIEAGESPPRTEQKSSLGLPWVGRHLQLQQLEACFANAANGEAQFAVITGDAGLGKTRLLNELVRRGRDCRAGILQASCYEPERAVAFGPITDALAKSFEPGSLIDLEPIWLNALSDIVPGLRQALTVLPTLSASSSQTRLFEAVVRLLEHLSKANPIILAIDDVQWSDRSTRALLSYISHRARHLRVLFIGALRVHRDKRLRPPWNEWTRVSVEEFSQQELGELVNQLGAFVGKNAPSVDNLAKLTAGHPYLVAEVLRAASEEDAPSGLTGSSQDVPNAIAAFASSMLDAHPLSCQRVVAVLAVIGRPAPIGLIRRVAKKHNVENALSYLVERGIIHIKHNLVTFRHDIIREAAYKRLTLLTRVELHRHTAAVMQHKKVWAGQAAFHYYRARLRKMAFKFALRAAKDADRRSAVYESVNYLELAIRARPERETFVRPLLAERLSRIHRYAKARTILRPILAANILSPAKIRGLRLLDLEMGFALGLDGVRLRDELTQIERQTTCDDHDLLHRAMRLRLRSALKDGIKDLITVSIRQLREVSLPNLDSNVRIESFAMAVKAHCLTHSSSEAETWTNALIHKCDDVTDHELRISVLGVLANVAYESGNLQRAEAIHNRALAEIQEIGAVTAWPIIASHHHMLLLELGKFDEASRILAVIHERTSSMDAIQTRAIVAANHASMLYDNGKYSDAKAAVNDVLPSVEGSNWVWIRLVLFGTLGLIAIQEGDLDRATELAEFGKNELRRLGLRMFDLSPMEILIARVDAIRQKRQPAILRLEAAILDYSERDVVCRLKMKLELARLLKPVDRQRARQDASEVFRAANAISARPLAERADSFLHGT